MGGLNLRTPGPTPLPPEVRAALARDMINHRGAEFAAVLRECIDGLKWAFQTQYDMLVMTASGTGGLEAAVVNIARAFGADVVELKVEWGRAANPQAIVDRLRAEPDVDTVFVTPNETSTGVLNPLPDIARAVGQARPDVLLEVDGISSVGSVAIRPEAWGCDVVIAGSQKG